MPAELMCSGKAVREVRAVPLRNRVKPDTKV
jgi:hypothetical protein